VGAGWGGGGVESAEYGGVRVRAAGVSRARHLRRDHSRRSTAGLGSGSGLQQDDQVIDST
jgi:hypothetical protein